MFRSLLVIAIVALVLIATVINYPHSSNAFSKPNAQPNTANNNNRSQAQSSKKYQSAAAATPITGSRSNHTLSSRPAAAPADFNGHEHTPFVKRLSLRDIERKGIGYKKGYATLEAMLGPDYRRGHWLGMVDLRGHHLYNDKYATNAGVIARYIPSSSCVIFGANAYWDYRNGCKGHYHQVGAGLELLGGMWAFRLNGTAPVSSHKHKTKCVFDDYSGGYFIIFENKEFSYWNANAELGAYLAKTNDFQLWFGAIPYFLTRGGNHNAWGGKVRLRPQYRDFLAMDFSVSHDHIYNTNWQAEVIVTLPLYDIYAKNNKKRCLRDRDIYQPVSRFEIIPLKKHSHVEKNF